MLDRIAGIPDEQAADSGAVASRLFRYLRPHWKMLLGVLAALLCTALGQASAPALIGRAVDQFITVGAQATDLSAQALSRSGLAQTMTLLFGAYLLNLIGFYGQVSLMGVVTQRILLTLRGDIFDQLQRLSLTYYDKHEAGDLMSRLVNDTEVIGNTFSQSLIQAVGSIFALIGIVIAMFLLNWQLALAALVILPVMFLTTRFFSARARAIFRTTRETIGDVSANLQEDISAVREAQAFNRTEQNISRFRETNAANRDANVRAGGVTSAFGPAIDVLSTIATAIVAGVGGWLAFNNLTTVGVVVAFLGYADRFFRPVQQISTLYTQMQAAFAAAERIFELMDTQPELADAPNAEPLPEIRGEVRVEEVSFAYEPGQWVLRDLSFVARPGQTVALVGPTGAGKTTLVNLIGRFYDVTSGRILIDGHDLRQITRRSLRTQMGVVPQDAFLFAGSIADNIRYGKANASQAEVEAAAEAARAAPFINALPEGYETRIGERGGTLSQGQRQLIAIARAILADPQLLVLDEATSSVDTRTERLIQQALDRLLEGRTAFVIAHRLSTIRNADLILVLDHGRIVQSGTHEELLRRGGLYAELHQRQIRPAA
ncbi:MAG: ABC transporter ATP-binding protein [Anaerolineales bacterium]|nr:ABC transporter ATP-binding protein [Anaerolineales bacterium]MCB9127810.1 ABC transporter ATP-binding protein [Ardenticatenales bacterium]